MYTMYIYLCAFSQWSVLHKHTHDVAVVVVVVVVLVLVSMHHFLFELSFLHVYSEF